MPMWKGSSNTKSSLATFFGPKPGSRASYTASDCAISAMLCPLNVRSDERGKRRGGGEGGQVDICQ